MANVGIHTPKQTEMYLNFFNEDNNSLTWEDCSWKNDESDSIWNEENGIVIMLPHNTETIYFYVTLTNDTEFAKEFYTVEEILDFLKEY